MSRLPTIFVNYTGFAPKRAPMNVSGAKTPFLHPKADCPVIQTHKGLVTAFSHGRVATGESEPQGEAEAGGGGARHPYLSVKSHSLLVGMREESSRGPRISRTRDGSLVVRKSTPISIMRWMSSSRLTTQALTDIPQRWASSTHSGCL